MLFDDWQMHIQAHHDGTDELWASVVSNRHGLELTTERLRIHKIDCAIGMQHLCGVAVDLEDLADVLGASLNMACSAALFVVTPVVAHNGEAMMPPLR